MRDQNTGVNEILSVKIRSQFTVKLREYIEHDLRIKHSTPIIYENTQNRGNCLQR